jgi:F-type H+-transporting ATPase subunit b
MEVLQQFGVTWGKLLAQILIFLIVYLVLNKFAFGPILAMLEQRKQRIAESEQNLERVRAELEGSETKAKEIVAEANKDAERIVAEAKEAAEAASAKKAARATTEAQAIREKAEEETRLERDRVMADLKRDFGRLVVDATTRVTSKTLTDSDQKRINKEAAAQVGL